MARRPAPLPPMNTHLALGATTETQAGSASVDRNPGGPATRQRVATARQAGTDGSDANNPSTPDLPPLVVPFLAQGTMQVATVPAALAGTTLQSTSPGAGQAEIDRLVDAFFERLAGTSERPEDPAYQQRWAEAQEESDARMRASLGGHEWLRYHSEAQRAAQPAERGIKGP